MLNHKSPVTIKIERNLTNAHSEGVEPPLQSKFSGGCWTSVTIKILPKILNLRHYQNRKSSLSIFRDNTLLVIVQFVAIKVKPFLQRPSLSSLRITSFTVGKLLLVSLTWKDPWTFGWSCKTHRIVAVKWEKAVLF